MSEYVIVGAGECGARAALALRERGFDGSITLLGTEPHLPYERPPLSKNVLVEGAPPRWIAPADTYARAGITVSGGRTVTRIDRAAHTLTLDNGHTLGYDKLLLATGARARALPGVPFSGRVLALRRYDDALRLRAHLQPGRHLVIVGGGLIGLEVAASARTLGAQVTVLESQPRLLARSVPERIASVLARRHADEGVKVLCNVSVEAIRPSPERAQITLADGRALVADALLVGIGALPRVELAQAAGLAIDHGIAVDATLRTSDPAIWAAGDCAACPLPLYDGRRVRLESWRNAQEQGALAAANMLGADEPIATVPWFWSDQYDLSLHVAGLIDGADIDIRRDDGEGAWMLFHLAADGRLLAASGIGAGNRIARDIRLSEKLIAARAYPAVDLLADCRVNLKSLLTRAAPSPGTSDADTSSAPARSAR